MESKQLADSWIASIVLLALGIGTCLVLRPFLTSLIWAAILTYSGWPLLRWIEERVGGRRLLATCLLTLLAFLIILAPLLIVALNLTDNSEEIRAVFAHFREGALPSPPDWVASVPVVGTTARDFWSHAVHDKSWLLIQLQGLQAPAGRFALAGVSILGKGVIELSLSLFIAFFMFCHGEHLANGLKAVFRRLAGDWGVHLMELAGNTISGVVYGVMGTAIIQSILTGIGLYVAGVPGAAALGLLTFFVSIVPIGPPLVWIPAAIWLYFQGSIGWAIALVVWGAIVVSSVDSFLKPMLISRGAKMPFILVLMGVMGGLFAFGFIGVFLGPTLIAVVYRLLQDWTNSQPNIIIVSEENVALPEAPPTEIKDAEQKGPE